ncbi:MAG: hypothetical protein KIT34_05045 [Cyanobacteria bacterium TGS_CYA1]|nr:hypothetical protein [Cyanobacteria bacterium TGS_CYA1]
MSEDKKEKDEKKVEKKPPVMKMARTSSADNANDQASIYDTTQIKTLAFTQNNPVAQAVADMLGKTEDPDIRNTIKKAATDVMKPELGSPEELSKKLEADKKEKPKEEDSKSE